jgi:class 3 adenylate cyclase/predicted ATPase
MWGATMDVGGWLRGLGLGQYETNFRDNKIDADLLPRLTVDDLKDIGVSAVGDRRRLLDAIALLAGSPAAPTKSGSPKGLERRPITVMFCDLVGSTGLAAKLDPEDWRNLVNAYDDEATRAVTGLGGHVRNRLGDGLMALFGYPHAQEDDAERAVRAALAIQRALAEINAKSHGKGAPELSARIGLESGPVVVEATGDVFGDAPNIAARVQAVAEPGSVLITMNVQRQVAGLFVADEQGARELKGVSEPVQLFRIVRASGGGRRGGARSLTPLVGRGEELELLRRRWERARIGAGQLTLIVGEPGIGKSRLIEEFRATLRETPHTFVELSSSQLLRNRPLHPITEWGRQRFGTDEPADRRLADLENTLRLIGLDPAEHAPLIAPLVDIPLPEHRAAKFAPEELRRRQLAALVAWFLAGARSQSVALAFEDLHWADPTSLDLMQALAERGAQAPMFILATARPEFRPPWSLRSHHSVISLSPLDRADVAQMVGELAARHALSQEVVEGVSERTGGVPLFVEEVTRLLLERGEQGGLQAIPPTLQQSLAARLDRLGEAREVAQIGAVLGRDFTYALLSAVGELDDPALQSALDRLAGADLLIAEGAGAQANYSFKHALIQDAAYDSLLKSRRQALHRRAAEILVGQHERPAAEPEVIAHHFTEAGLDDLAIEWWGKAGEEALRRSAFQEAISHLGKAIEMADKTAGGEPPATTASVSANRRLKLQTSLGQALMWSRGFVAEESKAALIRARELAAAVDNPTERFSTYFGLWVGNLVRGELGSAREIAETFLREAEHGAFAESEYARGLMASTCLWQGDFAEAQAILVEARNTYDPERDREAMFRFGGDPGTLFRAVLANIKWLLGEVVPARALIEEAVAQAIETGHVPSLAQAYMYKTHFEMVRGDAGAAARDAEILVKLGQENALSLHSALGAMQSAWASARQDGRRTGTTELRRVLTAYIGQGNKIDVPFHQGLIAEIEAEGDAAGALTRVDEALALARDTGEHWSDAFLHRLRGEILLKRDPANTGPAEEAFLTAITIAQQQKARCFDLRAALGLARLYHSTSRSADAHAVLASALEGFSPTPEFPEIEEAQALLAELAETDEVKNAAASRQRRLQLQTSLGQALMLSRGFGAEEANAAFIRARELAASLDNPTERLIVYHGLWIGNLLRAELRLAREIAEPLLREAERGAGTTERGVGRHAVGLTCLWQGDFVEAQANLLEALSIYDPERDREARFRFGGGEDIGALSRVHLAVTKWLLGEVVPARALIEEAVAQAIETGHVPTLVNTYWFRALFEMIRGDAAATRREAEIVVKLGQEKALILYITYGALQSAWASARLDDRETGATGLRQALAALTDQGHKLVVPFFQSLLAEIEAEGDAAGALTRVDEALALARDTGEHWSDAFLHRLRGEILLKRDPVNTALAEEAFLTAIAVAQQQKARSFELRAALDLAQLYHSVGRSVEAHALLASALEGFAPTPEFPEIAEARAVLGELSSRAG